MRRPGPEWIVGRESQMNLLEQSQAGQVAPVAVVVDQGQLLLLGGPLADDERLLHRVALSLQQPSLIRAMVSWTVATSAARPAHSPN
jgi:hypothetical protein